MNCTEAGRPNEGLQDDRDRVRLALGHHEITQPAWSGALIKIGSRRAKAACCPDRERAPTIRPGNRSSGRRRTCGRSDPLAASTPQPERLAGKRLPRAGKLPDHAKRRSFVDRIALRDQIESALPRQLRRALHKLVAQSRLAHAGLAVTRTICGTGSVTHWLQNPSSTDSLTLAPDAGCGFAQERARALIRAPAEQLGASGSPPISKRSSSRLAVVG